MSWPTWWLSSRPSNSLIPRPGGCDDPAAGVKYILGPSPPNSHARTGDHEPMKVYCPECDAPVRVPSDHPSGKKVRCPECDRAFRPDRDDAPARGRRSRADDDRPRRSKSKAKKSSNTAALVA